MQKKRPLVILIIAIFFGLMASVSMHKFLSSQKRQVQQTKTPAKIVQPVIIASKPMSMGDRVTENDIMIEQWAVAKIPRNSFAEPKEVVGRTVKKNISKGDILYPDNLLPKETVLEDIPPGHRAMSITISGYVGDESMFVPGGYLDILATFRAEDKTTVSKLILQNIKVLSVPFITEQRYRPGRKRDVVLAVKPEDAEALALANDRGDIYLVSRGLSDEGFSVTEGQDIEKLCELHSEQLALIKSIPKGKRAMTIWTISSLTTEKFLKAGTMADILVTYETESKEKVTKTILQDALILAIRSVQDMKFRPRNLDVRGTTSEVVLAVNPEDAENLALAAAKGDLNILPRPLEDHATYSLGQGAREDDTLKIEDTVEIIRGTEKEQQILDITTSSKTQ